MEKNALRAMEAGGRTSVAAAYEAMAAKEAPDPPTLGLRVAVEAVVALDTLGGASCLLGIFQKQSSQRSHFRLNTALNFC